jgi:hypothetical protein
MPENRNGVTPFDYSLDHRKAVKQRNALYDQFHESRVMSPAISFKIYLFEKTSRDREGCRFV